jgi:hypothetical protein
MRVLIYCLHAIYMVLNEGKVQTCIRNTLLYTRMRCVLECEIVYVD